MTGQAKGGAGDDGDFGFVQDVLGQYDVIVDAVDRFDGALGIGKAIEGAVGWQAAEAGYGIERFVDEIMALFILRDHVGDTALVTAERGGCGGLGDGAGV